MLLLGFGEFFAIRGFSWWRTVPEAGSAMQDETAIRRLAWPALER